MNPLLDGDMNSFSERFLSERGEGSCLPAAPLKFGRVLVPMDLSRASVSGLRYAARVVPTFGGSIWPIYVQEPAPVTGGMESVVMAVSDTEAAEGASKLLARFCREAVDASRRGNIVVCIGQPVRQITAAVCSLDMDLIVMTTHGYTGLRRVGHPSIAERVVGRSVCPVLTVHQALFEGKSDEGSGPPITWKSILVPVDLTESAIPVLQYAAVLAENCRGSVTLFYAAGTRWANGSRATRELRLTREETRSLAERLVGVKAHPETPRSEAFEKSLEIAQPDPEAIVQAARRLRSDLIVMGKHDCSWWKHLGKAAVAERVVRTAPCPVLSVPEKALTEESAAHTTPKAAEASPSPPLAPRPAPPRPRPFPPPSAGERTVTLANA